MFGHELTERQLGAIFARIPNSNDENACWLYEGMKNQEGYAMYSGTRLHRMMLENKLGRALGDKMLACHTCVKHRHCVNPNHLYEGTWKDNSKDMKTHGTIHSNKGRPRAKITDEQRAVIGQSRMDSYRLAQEYGLDPSTVRWIKRRWRATHPQETGTDTSAVGEQNAPSPVLPETVQLETSVLCGSA